MTTTCNNSICTDQYGCSSDVTPDFRLKRYDTKPAFEIKVKDCNTPIDLTDTVVEVSMWSTAKFKAAVGVEDTYFQLADNIGFNQALIGDIIVVGVPRNPEQMLITGFDETNNFIRVQREYNGSVSLPYKKGTPIRIFRILNSIGSTQMTLMDVEREDGTIEEDVITESKLIYDWAQQDTCLAGCYYLEMTLVKMVLTELSYVNALPDITPSWSPTDGTEVCGSAGEGVEWIRRFPASSEGYVIQIVDSTTGIPNLL